MKKSDLMPGDVIAVRNGNLYMFFGGSGREMAGLSIGTNLLSLSGYDEDLKHDRFDLDIVGVYRGYLDGDALRQIVTHPQWGIRNFGKIHGRKAPPTKKMTGSEIVEAPGYDIEIVKD